VYKRFCLVNSWNRKLGSVWALLSLVISQEIGVAQQPETTQVRPPLNVMVADVPNDAGRALIVYWTLSPDDRPKVEPRRVAGYKVERRVEEQSPEAISPKASHTEEAPNSEPSHSESDWRAIADLLPYGESQFVDTGCRPGITYRYRVTTVTVNGLNSVPAVSQVAVQPVINWFDFRRSWFLLILMTVCGLILGCTIVAKYGQPFYVRPIAGLQAIDEAVGRSTEMGKPMLFIPGILDMNEVETVAGLTILSRVAQTAAEYETPIEVPTTRSLVMTAAREAVQAACLTAGRPDAYDEERVHYITDEQFGYVASVCGWMQREQPAACFYLGKFYAESLVLAETGNAVGAIQIGGTGEASQLPFFVAACDYTLIGEELFAASAYLSGEPEQLGTLKGQDFGKLLAATLLLAGCVLATLVSFAPQHAGFTQASNYFMNTILGKGE